MSNLTDKQRGKLTATHEAHPEWGGIRLAKAARCQKHHADTFLRTSRGGSRPSKATTKKGGAMNRAGLQKKYDHNTKTRESIRAGIATLKEADNPDEDDILDDVTFRTERCDNPNTNGYRQIADESEFRRNQFLIGDRLHWTTPRTKKWALVNVSRARDVD